MQAILVIAHIAYAEKTVLYSPVTTQELVDASGCDVFDGQTANPDIVFLAFPSRLIQRAARPPHTTTELHTGPVQFLLQVGAQGTAIHQPHFATLHPTVPSSPPDIIGRALLPQGGKDPLPSTRLEPP